MNGVLPCAIYTPLTSSGLYDRHSRLDAKPFAVCMVAVIARDEGEDAI